MANPEHRQRLDTGVEAWNAWRQENLFLRPDLSDADLRRADLSGFFVEPSLHMNLRRAKLTGANLTHAKLDYADLREADLRGARLYRARLVDSDMSRACLEEADLRRAVLAGARMIGTKLREANLRNAVLAGASLTKANLRDAVLVGADLSDANLHRTTLDGADLRRVNFRSALFSRTTLEGANVSHARFMETTVADCDLSALTGLAELKHVGPSSFDTFTLSMLAASSQGSDKKRKLVEQLLADLRLPGPIARGVEELASPEPATHSCFISYNHSNRTFARRLYRELQTRGVQCWLDEHDILPGERIDQAIDRGITGHTKLLLCCSVQALTSWWVQDEIDKALEKERRKTEQSSKGEYVIIPLDLDNYLFEWEDGRAATIRSRLAADFTNWQDDEPKFYKQLERVIRALELEQ